MKEKCKYKEKHTITLKKLCYDTNDEKASSLVGGVQLGLNYPLTNSLKLNVNSKYLRHNYETKLEPTNTASASLEHKSTASLGLGLVYSF